MESQASPADASVVVPEWLAVADDEERAELAALGIDNALPSGPADRGALASMFLRRVFYIERDISRLAAIQAREAAALEARFARYVAPLRARHSAFGAALREIAAVFPYPGKAKSQKVGWGVIGTSKKPDVVQITDEPALVEWAKVNAPEVLSFTLSLPYAEAAQLLPPEVLARGDIDVGRAKVRPLLVQQDDAQDPAKAPVVGAVMALGASEPYFKVEGLAEVIDD